jgi:putative PIN family toxin of toxin-antitoxin system
MNRKWVVIDTNVLISAFLKADSTPRQALIKALKSGNLLESRHTFSELSTRIYRNKFDKYTTDELRTHFLRSLASQCVWITPTQTLSDCKADPDDNRFLELAVAGQASYIVTGDRDLLDMNPYRGISIITPKEFVNATY